MSKIFNFPPDLYKAVIIGDACPIDPSIVFAVNTVNGGVVLSRMTDIQLCAKNIGVVTTVGTITFLVTFIGHFE